MSTIIFSIGGNGILDQVCVNGMFFTHDNTALVFMEETFLAFNMALLDLARPHSTDGFTSFQ